MAKKSGNIIFLSKDSDFSELVSRLGSPPKLILLGIGNANNQTLWNWIRPNINEAIRVLVSTEADIVLLD